MSTMAGKDATAEVVVPEVRPTLLCTLEMKLPESPTEYNEILINFPLFFPSY
jgi:hypothetical protein